MTRIHKSFIREVRQLNDRYCHVSIVCPELAAEAKPGQFVNIQVGETGTFYPLLKRPFGIYRVNDEAGEVELLIKVVGSGTKMLWDLGSREMEVIGQRRELDVIGPLGEGFRLQERGNALLVGGGIGVAPLYELAVRLRKDGVKVRLLLGLTDETDLVLAREISDLRPETILVRPGASGFRQGLVTGLVREHRLEEYDQIYVCGPEPMLAAVQGLLDGQLSKSQFSMEEKMGCGVGLCFSCTCKVKREADPAAGQDGWNYERVCTRGPVFRGDEVIFRG